MSSGGQGEVGGGLTPRDRWAVETMARQAGVIDALAAEATSATVDASRCALWRTLRRQAASYRRYLDPWSRSAGFSRTLPAITRHHAILEDHQKRARAELEQFDEDTRRRAQAAVGIRLAVVGKGGAGKTVLAATLARLLAQRHRNVLAVDLDTNPGLAMSLGMAPTEAGLPREVLEEHPGANYGWHLASGVHPREVVERCAVVGPDGVRFLGVGKISSPDKAAAKQSVAALVQVLLGFDRPGWDVIADLEAGPTTPFERYHAFAEDVALVVTADWRSAMTGRRLSTMIDGQRAVIVANRFDELPDHPGLPSAVRIPFDAEVAEAERFGRSAMDACPGARAVKAVAQLSESLLPEGGGTHQGR